LTCLFVILCEKLGKEKVDEFWYEHPNDFIIVKNAGYKKNLDFMLYYIKDAPLDLNLLNKDDTPFTLKFQNQ
jgi:hypothetical protein